VAKAWLSVDVYGVHRGRYTYSAIVKHAVNLAGRSGGLPTELAWCFEDFGDIAKIVSAFWQLMA